MPRLEVRQWRALSALRKNWRSDERTMKNYGIRDLLMREGQCPDRFIGSRPRLRVSHKTILVDVFNLDLCGRDFQQSECVNAAVIRIVRLRAIVHPLNRDTAVDWWAGCTGNNRCPNRPL